MRELFEPAAESRQRWYWTPAVVLVLGVFSIVLLVSTLWITDRKTEQNLAVARAVIDLQSAVAYWHLWLEEYLTGDRYVDLDRDVAGNQRLALRLASMLLRGGEREGGEVIDALQDPWLREKAEALEKDLIEFRDLSEERLARPEAAGVGTAIDQRFDETFLLVKSHAEELRRLDEEYLERDRNSFRFRMGIIVVTWALIVASALAGLGNREKRRQQAEDTLRASQRWLAKTLSSIGDGVVTTDLEGRIFFMNPMAETLTGWTRQEASGKPIDEVFRVFQDTDNRPIENPVAKVLHSGEAVGVSNHTVLLNRRSDNCYAIDEGAAPIRDDEGHILGVVLVFRDVTQRRQTERTLRQREAELRQSQKMEAVGRLAGGLAHDVNNYLGAIRGYCEVAMLKGESGAALTTRMSSAIETADKVSALIRQLLAFSRRQPVQPEVIDLNRVVQDMKVLMERLLGEDVALETCLAGELWSIELDPSQVEQILVNLLVNARDAMPTGGGIVVETRNMEVDRDSAERHPPAKPGRYVRLAVADAGCGIPAAVQDKIFDPFFTTKDDSDSSGLGLATVYGIVHQNGGFVTVESEVGEGATFEIYLPASDQAAAPRQAAGAAPVAASEPLGVLLVEDNADMRASTRTLLELQGHAVRAAASGEEALTLLAAAEEPFDLLVTDVVMPEMSGKELYDRIRERHADVQCLFISGYTDNAMLRHGLSQDRVHFLQKPFSSESLARKIAEVLGKSASGAGSDL